jgi:hypothetical protein
MMVRRKAKTMSWEITILKWSSEIMTILKISGWCLLIFFIQSNNPKDWFWTEKSDHNSEKLIQANLASNMIWILKVRKFQKYCLKFKKCIFLTKFITRV